jgi:hypothetical protein
VKVKFLLSTVALVLGASGLAWADQHPVPLSAIQKLPPQQQQCRACHKQVTPKVYNQWAHSRHAVANVRCFQCHGTLTNFHKTPPLTKCMACHYDEVVTMQQKKPGFKCWDCHEIHVFEFHGKGVTKIKTAKDFHAPGY